MYLTRAVGCQGRRPNWLQGSESNRRPPGYEPRKWGNKKNEQCGAISRAASCAGLFGPACDLGQSL